MECPGAETLAELVEGRVQPSTRAAVERHLETCASCRQVLALWARCGGAPPTAEVGGPPPEPPAVLRRGAVLGRFVLLDELGAGGMGVVYSAYDTHLDRRVALKLLRPDLEETSDLARVRMLHEAQAMARLSHANVVIVHDVQLVDERVVIAMELVEGTTLTGWLAAAPRTREEILGVFRQAGRGLAAAHAAGLVHRDFKPNNVLIQLDGRAKVSDFGLARRATLAAGEPALPHPGRPPMAAAPGPTREDVVVGTPAYMAPEQLAGLAADARSDQFAFCVALFEALCGVRPFATHALRRAPAHDVALRPWPRQSPARVRAAVERGLSIRPEDRFPGMNELLAALEAGSARRRRRWWIVAALGVAASVGGAVLVSRGLDPGGCRAGETLWRGVWGPEARQRVLGALVGTRRPYASSTWAGVDRGLSDFGAAWVAGYHEACAATRLRHEQPENVLELRQACLAERLGQARAVVELLADADERLVERAVGVAGGLAPVADCAAITRLLAPPPPPADAASRAHIDEVNDGLARARALRDAARYDLAAVAVVPAVAAARELHYTPLIAEALYLQGSIAARDYQVEAAETALDEAVAVALASRANATAARALNSLIFVVQRKPEGQGRARTRQLNRWVQGLIAGLGGDDGLEAERLINLGNWLYSEARYEEAIRIQRQGLALLERMRPADPVGLARMLNNLANSNTAMGNYAEAAEINERSYAFMVEHLGPLHPFVATALGNQAEVLDNLGRHDEALAKEQRAIEVITEGLGPGHWLMGNALRAKGNTLSRLGQDREALAVELEAVDVALRTGGENFHTTGLSLLRVAQCMLRVSRAGEALTYARRARAVFAYVFSPKHPTVGMAEAEVGWALLGLGRGGEALESLESATALLVSGASEFADRARARFGLAIALTRSGRDRARARTLAGEARELYGQTSGFRRELAEVDAWLSTGVEPSATRR